MTFIGSATTSTGRLRALSGRDGHELFTVTDPAHALSGWANLALGNIDGDAAPEIVAVHQNGQSDRLREQWRVQVAERAADRHRVGRAGDRRPRRRPASPRSCSGGRPCGRTGGSCGRAPAATGDIRRGTLSTVVDLDLDGTPEVRGRRRRLLEQPAPSCGTTRPCPTGIRRWGTSTRIRSPRSCSWPGVSVWLLEHTGAVRWGPAQAAGPGQRKRAGRSPISTATGGRRSASGTGKTYTVIETAGLIRWSVATTQARTPWNFGVVASAFDFDGDGAAELVFSDESALKILRGLDGALLAE